MNSDKLYVSFVQMLYYKLYCISVQMHYLLIACLHAEENDVSCCTSQTSFQVRLTSDFFSLHIVSVQCLHCLFKQGPLNLLTFINKHPGKDMEAHTQHKACKRENCSGMTVGSSCSTIKLPAKHTSCILLNPKCFYFVKQLRSTPHLQNMRKLEEKITQKCDS